MVRKLLAGHLNLSRRCFALFLGLRQLHLLLRDRSLPRCGVLLAHHIDHLRALLDSRAKYVNLWGAGAEGDHLVSHQKILGLAAKVRLTSAERPPPRLASEFM